MAHSFLSRRRLLASGAVALAASPVLAACQQAPATPQVVERVVTQVVTQVQTQVVERQVTQVVEKQVTQIVTQIQTQAPQVVTQIQTAAPQVMVVTATPVPATATPAPKGAASKQELNIYFQTYTDFAPHRDGGIGMYHGQLVHGGLLKLDDKGQIQPMVAESFTQSSDKLVTTFKIRKDLKFAPSGREVKAIDIKNCLSFICQNLRSWMPDTYMPMVKGAIKSYADAQKTIKVGSGEVAQAIVDVPGFVAKDDYTFEIHTDYPAPALIPFVSCNTLSGWTIFDVEQNKKDTPTARYHANGAGSVGPYMFKSFDQTTGDMVMVQNPHYVLGPKPKLTQISFKRIADSQTRLIAYQNNTVDYVWAAAPADAKQFSQPSHPMNKELKIWPATAYFWWGLNLDKEPFNDLNFRKALAMSIDYKKVHDAVFGPLAQVATSIIPAGPYHRADAFPKFYKLDKDAATAAFKESKYGGDTKKVPPITWGISAANSDHLLWAQAAQQMIRTNLGVTIQLSAKDSFSPDETKNLDIRSQSWGSATLDPSEWTWQWTPPDETSTAPNFGYPPRSDKAKTDAWKKIVDENFDEAARKKAYFEAEDYMVNNFHTLAGYYSGWLTLLKPWVKGLNYYANWTMINTDQIFIEEH